MSFSRLRHTVDKRDDSDSTTMLRLKNSSDAQPFTWHLERRLQTAWEIVFQISGVRRTFPRGGEVSSQSCDVTNQL